MLFFFAFLKGARLRLNSFPLSISLKLLSDFLLCLLLCREHTDLEGAFRFFPFSFSSSVRLLLDIWSMQNTYAMNGHKRGVKVVSIMVNMYSKTSFHPPRQCDGKPQFHLWFTSLYVSGCETNCVTLQFIKIRACKVFSQKKNSCHFERVIAKSRRNLVVLHSVSLDFFMCKVAFVYGNLDLEPEPQP